MNTNLEVRVAQVAEHVAASAAEIRQLVVDAYATGYRDGLARAEELEPAERRPTTV